MQRMPVRINQGLRKERSWFSSSSPLFALSLLIYFTDSQSQTLHLYSVPAIMFSRTMSLIFPVGIQWTFLGYKKASGEYCAFLINPVCQEE